MSIHRTVKLHWEGNPELDLEPRIHMMDDFNNEKFKVQRSQPMIKGQGILCRMDKRLAKCLYTTVAAFPIPPEVEKGVKQPYSTS